MKKRILIILLFCISIFMVFAETNVSLNKEMYVKENLRLRSEENTSSLIVTVMRIGSKVKIVKLGKEETIDAIHSKWVKIEVLDGKTKNGESINKGTVGWCFGGYLADYVGKYDYLDLSDRDFKIQKVDFKNDIDASAWKKLAGYYFVGNPRQTIPEPIEIDTPWGKDYGGLGLGCHSISYKNGIWTHGGDGEAETFELESISKDGNTFMMKNKYYSQVWKIDGDYLYINNSSYYKITGPDCYKKFLREFVKKYNESVQLFNNNNEETKKIENAAHEILKALTTGNIKKYSEYTSKDSIVNLKIGDYRGKENFTYKELTEESEDVINAFNFMKSDLSSHLSNIDSVTPNINEFVRTTTEDFKTNYPSANYLVEYIFNKYEEIELFFKVENDKIILVGLKEYAEFRP